MRQKALERARYGVLVDAVAPGLNAMPMLPITEGPEANAYVTGAVLAVNGGAMAL